MTIHVDLVKSDLACVSFVPSLFARLVLRQQEQERFAVRCPSINGGYVWLWDATSRPIEDDVRRAIDDETARLEWQRIIAPKRHEVRR